MGIQNNQNHCSISNDYIITTSKITQEIGKDAVGKVFYEKMKSYGNAVAQIDAETNQSETYASLLQRCIQTAAAMQQQEVKSGDLVFICTRMHIDAVVPFFASLFLGAIPTSFDIDHPEEWTQHAEYIQPKIIFSSLDVINIVKDLVNKTNLKIRIITFGNEFENFMNVAVPTEEFIPANVTDMKKTAFIFMSSGTTGPSKAICSSHIGYLSGAYRIINNGYSIERLLLDGPVSCSTVAKRLGCVVLSGGCWITIAHTNPDYVWTVIEKYKITTMLLDPLEVRGLLSVNKKISADTTLNVKHLVISGSIAPVEDITAIRNILPTSKILPMYGMTEFDGSVLQFNGTSEEDALLIIQKPQSIGRPIAGFDYKIVDLNTNKAVGPYQPGELKVRPNVNMSNYINAKQSSLDSEGFCGTGDILYYDEDFCFYYVDRINQTFISRSKLISPLYLEKIIEKHPSVYAAAVVGIPHPEDDNHPIAVVVLKKDAKDTNNIADKIKDFVNNQVEDYYKITEAIKIIDSIPLTATAKIKRQLIKEMIMNKQI